MDFFQTNSVWISIWSFIISLTTIIWTIAWSVFIHFSERPRLRVEFNIRDFIQGEIRKKNYLAITVINTGKTPVFVRSAHISFKKKKQEPPHLLLIPENTYEFPKMLEPTAYTVMYLSAESLLKEIRKIDKLVVVDGTGKNWPASVLNKKTFEKELGAAKKRTTP
ncbi:MAG: hypothetical protein QE263_03565 [Vampirovibrionales bacterium]|nr:hypothetical protein [Vampirovibrionales bacterium]